MNIKGKLVEIFDTQQIKESFRKREFVVEFRENSQYAEFLKFELVQDKCDLLNSFNNGEEVEVYFNLKGRSWVNAQGEKLYFNTLQAWRIDRTDSTGNPAPEDRPGPENFEGDSDNLPF